MLCKLKGVRLMKPHRHFRVVGPPPKESIIAVFRRRNMYEYIAQTTDKQGGLGLIARLFRMFFVNVIFCYSQIYF
jgi:hypothetical protein